MKRQVNSILFKKSEVPFAHVPEGLFPSDFLSQKAHECLDRHLERAFPNRKEREEKRSTYEKRLDDEIAAISKAGLSCHFLNIADVLQKTREQGFSVRPCKGTCTGSLLNYCLHITNIDPVQYNLLFESFFNPCSEEIPVFTMDSCMQGSARATHYLKEILGGNAVYSVSDSASDPVHPSDQTDPGLLECRFRSSPETSAITGAVLDIRKLESGMENFSLDDIPLDDEATFKLLSSGQLFSGPAKDILSLSFTSSFLNLNIDRNLSFAKPSCFKDLIPLIAMSALRYRFLVFEYIDRMHWGDFEYPDEWTKSILKETYGFMIYKEQVLQMVQAIGMYTLGGADLLCRNLLKENSTATEEHRQVFRDGAARQGIPIDQADGIFDRIKKEIRFLPSKSNATNTALLIYQVAYLKCHYPAEFMAACMNLAMNDNDRLQKLMQDAKEPYGLTILPPDINLSGYEFHAVRSTEDRSGCPASQIRFGLGAVLQTDQNVIKAIIAARKVFPYKDVIDLFIRIGSREAERTINTLGQAGALDCIEPNRPAIRARSKICSRTMQNIENRQISPSKAWEILRLKLCFISYDFFCEEHTLLKEEKKVLGLCLSSHLFDCYAKEAELYTHTRLNTIKASGNSQWMAGVVAGLRIEERPRGRLMVVTLDDGTAEVDVSLFGDLIEERHSAVEQDEFLLVFGRVWEDRCTGRFRVTAEVVYDLAQARLRFIEKNAHLYQIKLNGMKNSKMPSILSFLSTRYLPRKSNEDSVSGIAGAANFWNRWNVKGWYH